jgi:hypothetical protein
MEVWKDIIGYEGLYQISNYGEIISLYFGNNKKLKLYKGSHGYLCINLHKDKKQYVYLVHRLLYESFYNVKSTRKNVIDHIDNNKLNNNLLNLQYITNRENSSKDKKSKTGYSNIYLNSGSYLVRLRINNVKKSIGTFKNIEDAVNFRNNFIKNIAD